MQSGSGGRGKRGCGTTAAIKGRRPSRKRPKERPYAAFWFLTFFCLLPFLAQLFFSLPRLFPVQAAFSPVLPKSASIRNMLFPHHECSFLNAILKAETSNTIFFNLEFESIRYCILGGTFYGTMLVKLANSVAPPFVSVQTPLGKVGTADFNAPTAKFVLNLRLPYSSPKLKVTVNGALQKQRFPQS